jgi:hypothetical protein
MDAARLGCQGLLPARCLTDAAIGYLGEAERANAAPGWPRKALEWATAELRGAVQAVQPVPPAHSTGIAGRRVRGDAPGTGAPLARLPHLRGRDRGLRDAARRRRPLRLPARLHAPQDRRHEAIPQGAQTVMTSREVKRISGLAYDLRSHTGHQGSLFGPEQTFGYSPHLSLFNVAGDAVFDYVILGELRNASRQVLAKALGRPS